MRTVHFALPALLILIAPLVHAVTKADLVGTWQLEIYNDVNPDQSETPWCNSPTGLLTYTDLNYMSVAINCDKSTPITSPSQDANNRLFYSGTYTVDSAKAVVVHHVQNSSLDDFIGQNLARHLTLAGSELTLTSIDPQTGKRDFYLRWKRAPLVKP